MKVEKHIFSADRPILKSEDDLLNRSSFSKKLATSISEWKEKDSLVVAIYGAWGDGKTSLKNMIKEHLLGSETQKTLDILEFTPWQWNNENIVTEAFFHELIGKLRTSKGKNEQLAAKKLEEYAEYLELSSEVTDKFKNFFEKIFLLFTGGAIGGFSLTTTLGGNQSIIKFFAVTTVAFMLATVFLNEIIWFLKVLIKWKKLSFGSTEGSLEEKKREIESILSNLGKTIVVIIDDVDRLSKIEIKTIFRLIKANADFPNIVYLTLFQRDIIEKSLTEADIYSGTEYLKKIVQVGFNLPKVPKNEIYDILFSKLNIILKETNLDHDFNKSRWNELFMEGIKSYFSNLRDVNRFISTLKFHIGVLKHNGAFEVNFIDLLAIEVLRQFEPKVYEQIFFSKNTFTSPAPSGSGFSVEAKKKEINDTILLAEESNRESVKGILKVIFPNVQWAWSNYYSGISADDFADLKINHPEKFDLYFSLILPDGEIPQSEIDHALSITHDKEELFSFFLKYHQQGRLSEFVKKFESYKLRVSKDHPREFLEVMLRLGDYLDDETAGFFTASPILNVRRIIHWYLQKQDWDIDKKAMFKQVLSESSAIYLPIDLLAKEIQRNNEERYPDHFVFEADDKEALIEIFRQRINSQKDTDNFKENMHLPRIVFAWKNVLSEEEALTWLEQYTAENTHLISFLKRSISKGRVASGYEEQETFAIRVNWLREFFNEVEQIFKRVEEIKKIDAFSIDDNKLLFETLDTTVDEYKNPEKYHDR